MEDKLEEEFPSLKKAHIIYNTETDSYFLDVEEALKIFVMLSSC